MRPSFTPLSSVVLSRRSFTVKAVLAAVGGLAGLRAARAQQAVDPNAPKPLAENVSLRDLMTPEQFRAAGLKKLSSDELASLERFLKGYRDETVQTVTQNVAKQTEERTDPAPRRDRGTHRAAIEGRIQGHFAGLTGRTRIVLEDGSVWQEANGEKFVVSLDNPEVVLVRSFGGYKMYITGAPRSFYVRQIVL